MAVIRNKRPIDQTFNAWVRNFPESFHPLDMKRFYRFVKTVCVYSRRPKGAAWLRERLAHADKRLSEDVIDTYCDLFETLQAFYKVRHLPLYQLSRD